MSCVEDSFADTVGEIIKETKSKYHINELILVKNCGSDSYFTLYPAYGNLELINLHMQVIMVAFKLGFLFFPCWELLIRTTRGRQCCLRRYIFKKNFKMTD